MSEYEKLVALVGSQGFTEEESRHAIRRCLMAVARNGAIGYGAGGLIGFFLAGPGIPVVMGGAAAAYTFVQSPSCGEVRTALQAWRSPLPEEQ